MVDDKHCAICKVDNSVTPDHDCLTQLRLEVNKLQVERYLGSQRTEAELFDMREKIVDIKKRADQLMKDRENEYQRVLSARQSGQIFRDDLHSKSSSVRSALVDLMKE